jgi:ketosteroid isomerase-like protein
MTDRAEMVRVLEEVYAARKTNDVKQILECFAEHGRYAAVGKESAAAGRAAQTSALGGVVGAFELLDYKIHCMVIEGPHAAVHWRGKFRATATDKVAETDLLDLVEVRDGRIVSFNNYFDTALAARLATP